MLIKRGIRSFETVHVLRHRSFALFVASQMAEDASDSLYLVALPGLVRESGGSGADLGLTGAAAVLPFLLIGPISGVLVDRVSRSLVLVGSNILRAVALASLLLMGWTTGLETEHIATAAFIMTAADVVAFAARGALTPGLVPVQELVAGNALRIAGWQVVSIGGKAMAGVLVVTIGSFSTLGVGIGLYAVAVLLLLPIRAAVAPPTQSVHPAEKGLGIAPVVKDFATGAMFVARHPILRALAITGVVVNATSYPLLGLLLVVLFENVLEAGPRSYGLFLSAGSGGVLLAMTVAPQVARRVGEGRLGATSLTLWGGGLALMAVVGDLTQSQTPDELRGRVEGNLMAVSLALTPLTSVLGGVLMNSIGPRPLYAIAGITVAACGLALLTPRAVRQARFACAATPGTPGAAGGAVPAVTEQAPQCTRAADS
jgi:MFS family permease